ncbi:hypothetical protein A359_03720 [secondary endosymbiont of Ctenarytaina eucalypti]|uniref:Uncharacterized protein n=1 Tax=secondary endosymbiont of Ctenarytaina eucalypti TaxID=1199245 RepID=J3VS08_9ENTR|nr:hypothetical protein A359_03720 [secondary endosymbiont of Ctenarytaina eucalypti]
MIEEIFIELKERRELPYKYLNINIIRLDFMKKAYI